MISALVYLIIELVVLGFIAWAVTLVPFLQGWGVRIVQALCGLIAFILIVFFVLGLVGYPVGVYGGRM